MQTSARCLSETQNRLESGSSRENLSRSLVEASARGCHSALGCRTKGADDVGRMDGHGELALCDVINVTPICGRGWRQLAARFWPHPVRPPYSGKESLLLTGSCKQGAKMMLSEGVWRFSFFICASLLDWRMENVSSLCSFINTQL